MTQSRFKLIVTDIDNTVFDWVDYYTHALWALLDKVSSIIKVPAATLAEEARDVFSRHGSIEFPFLTQELPSVMQHYGSDIDRMLNEVVEPGRLAFMAEAAPHLRPYAGVHETLQKLRQEFPDVPTVALTDAPRYVAMWKLNKLGLLHDFAAVYGLADPRIPTCEKTRRVKVSPTILLKHLQQSNFEFRGRIRILPDEYEKPGTRGLKTVLMDYDSDEDPAHRQSVLWIGDNLRKDVGLGQRLGVCTAWAEYGTHLDKALLPRLHAFSPPQNIHKNVPLDSKSPESPKPDFTLTSFADILPIVRG